MKLKGTIKRICSPRSNKWTALALFARIGPDRGAAKAIERAEPAAVLERIDGPSSIGWPALSLLYNCHSAVTHSIVDAIDSHQYSNVVSFNLKTKFVWLVLGKINLLLLDCTR